MIDVKKSIELLRDDNNYYGEFGRNFMSNTDVKALIDDPVNFKQGSIDAVNLAKGRLTHVLLFEPHKVSTLKISAAVNRNSSLYKQDCHRLGEKYLLLQKDFTEMAFLVGKIKQNLEVYEMMFHHQAVFEEPNLLSYLGLWWKTKADSKTPDIVIDFKSTGDLSRFKWAAKEYCYDSQAFLYGKSYNVPVVFVVGEKGTGKIGVFECGNDFLRSGSDKVNMALDNYNKYWNPETKTEEPNDYFIKQQL